MKTSWKEEIGVLRMGTKKMEGEDDQNIIFIYVYKNIKG